MKNTIDSRDLKQLLDDTPDAAVVIDVRRRSDYETDPHLIPGARWQDPEQIDIWSKDIPKNKPVVVYCVRGGSVSQSVSAKLAQEQIPVRYLEGGLAAWDLTSKEES
jgi:rhodanese-related sulfurtransferase